MTLGVIKQTALMQLGEDTEDIAEYDALFTNYANYAYALAVERLKPRETYTVKVNSQGEATIDYDEIVRVVKAEDAEGNDVLYDIQADGRSIRVLREELKGKRLTLLCEVHYDALAADTEEPRIPSQYHMALVDYICFRHLMNGNLAKQSRAQAYQTQFFQNIARIRPQGTESVTRMQNLYLATDLRYRG